MTDRFTDSFTHRSSRWLRASRAVAVITALAVAALHLPAAPVRAQEKDPAAALPIIRDAEIEQLLRDYTQPVLRVAGLGQRNIRVVVINDRSFNAFVVDAKRIFVNTGALTDAETPNQIIGVLAHETGHIAGGHLSKLRAELANAQTASILAMLLGIGAVAATAASRGGVGGNPMAAVAGPQSVIMRSLMAYQRQQEEQADRAGVNFLTQSGQSAKGMYDTFKRFADQALFASRYVDPYVQSHPMPAERIAALAEVARSNPYLGQEGPTGTATAARYGARQAVRLPGSARYPDAALSAEQHQPSGALRPRGFKLPPLRSAQCSGADRRVDPGRA